MSDWPSAKSGDGSEAQKLRTESAVVAWATGKKGATRGFWTSIWYVLRATAKTVQET